jgi:hypothetical protein
MIQAEVVHRSLAKILSQAKVDLPSEGSELRLVSPVRSRLGAGYAAQASLRPADRKFFDIRRAPALQLLRP